MKNFLLSLLLCLAACGKDDDGVTMNPDGLAGTYWKQTRSVEYVYQDGKLTDTFQNNFDGSLDGGAGPTVLSFLDDNTLVEYHKMSPTGQYPDTFYKSRKFDYAPDARSLVIYEPEQKPARQLVIETFTADKIVWTSITEASQGTMKYLVKRREVYHRYKPSDEWQREVARYPDYDRIDWNATP